MKRLSGGRLARLAFAAAAMMLALAPTPARAGVLVQIDKSSQRMAVSVDGMMRYNWPVSTGRSGYGTPSGVFHPQLMARRWFSRKYYNSPMPHAIFFYGGFAIHGTYELSRLGGPASHGCVRLHPSNAAALFALVERNGPRNTRIEISNFGRRCENSWHSRCNVHGPRKWFMKKAGFGVTRSRAPSIIYGPYTKMRFWLRYGNVCAS
jgi:hypothetical protein